jgi:hypothetical protein
MTDAIDEFANDDPAEIREEFTSALDTVEAYVLSDNPAATFRRAWPDVRERAELARRLDGLWPVLEEVAMRVWPDVSRDDPGRQRP